MARRTLWVTHSYLPGRCSLEAVIEVFTWLVILKGVVSENR